MSEPKQIDQSAQHYVLDVGIHWSPLVRLLGSQSEQGAGHLVVFSIGCLVVCILVLSAILPRSKFKGQIEQQSKTNEPLDSVSHENHPLETAQNPFDWQHTAVDVIAVSRFVELTLNAFQFELGNRVVFDFSQQTAIWITLPVDLLEKLLSNLVVESLLICELDQQVTYAIDCDCDTIRISICGLNEAQLQSVIFNTRQLPAFDILTYYHQAKFEHSESGVSLSFCCSKSSPQEIASAVIGCNEVLIESIMHKLVSPKPTVVAMDSTIEKPYLLIVDDDKDAQLIFSSIFEHRYIYKVADEAELALELAIETIPDLVIISAQMPDTSGFELTKLLRNEPLTSHLPIIMTCRSDFTENRRKAWAVKADECLLQPIDPDDLLLRIDNLLAIRRSLVHQWQSVKIAHDIVEPEETSPDVEISTKALQKSELLQRHFMTQLEGVLQVHLSDTLFDVGKLATALRISKRQLNRQMKGTLGVTPWEAIRRYRLNRAAALLLEGHPPSNVIYDVGFTSHSHFSACFKAQFGVSPGAYRQAKAKKLD